VDAVIDLVGGDVQTRSCGGPPVAAARQDRAARGRLIEHDSLAGRSGFSAS